MGSVYQVSLAKNYSPSCFVWYLDRPWDTLQTGEAIHEFMYSGGCFVDLLLWSDLKCGVNVCGLTVSWSHRSARMCLMCLLAQCQHVVVTSKCH